MIVFEKWNAVWGVFISWICLIGSFSIATITIQLIHIAMIHHRITLSIHHFESNHPIAGHTRNANQKAAPIIPIFFVFVAGVDISDI